MIAIFHLRRRRRHHHRHFPRGLQDAITVSNNVTIKNIAIYSWVNVHPETRNILS